MFFGAAYAFPLWTFGPVWLSRFALAVSTGLFLLFANPVAVPGRSVLWSVGRTRVALCRAGAGSDAADTAAACRHRGHADAWLAVRSGYADEATRAVDVEDLRDPHPYWLDQHAPP